jgi:hypothetical protein
VPLSDLEQVTEVAKMLLSHIDFGEKKIRLLGIAFSNFGAAKTRDPYKGLQRDLFSND